MRINIGFDGNTPEATSSFPLLSASFAAIDFGQVNFGQVNAKSLTIKNLGLSRLNLEAEVLQDGFTLGSDSILSILGGDSTTVRVHFSPVQTRLDSAKLMMQSNDPQQGDFIISLYGLGKLGGESFGWLRAKYSPFLVSAAMTVPRNQSLTIEPGTSVLVEPGAGIKIQGSLLAEGTAADSIVFYSALASSIAGSWPGLRFEFKTEASQSVIRYCRFSHVQMPL
jgi:hypothetical protein